MLRLRHSALPLLILVVGALASLLFATQIARTENARTQARFQAITASVLQDIETKGATQITLLRGLAGFFNASAGIDRTAFRTYVARLKLGENYPGVLGLGYAEAASGAAEIARIEARGRAEKRCSLSSLARGCARHLFGNPLSRAAGSPEPGRARL